MLSLLPCTHKKVPVSMLLFRETDRRTEEERSTIPYHGSQSDSDDWDKDSGVWMNPRPKKKTKYRTRTDKQLLINKSQLDKTQTSTLEGGRGQQIMAVRGWKPIFFNVADKERRRKGDDLYQICRDLVLDYAWRKPCWLASFNVT
jgi:hypothetical protein